MKQEILERLEGYQEIKTEIEIARKYGTEFQDERGTVSQLINRLHPKNVALNVVDIIELTPSTKTIRLVANEVYLPPFQAGQYISVAVKVDGVATNRPYSISSSPTERGYWDVTVKRVENGFVSNYLLDELKIGDEITTSGPQGVFCYNPLIFEKTIVCLAGGSGITPFMSMARELALRRKERNMILLYGSRDLNDAIFHSELQELSGKLSNFTYIPVIENPPDDYTGNTGYLSAETISAAVKDLNTCTFMICGPQAMYDYCAEQLENLEIPKKRIRRELYGPPKNIWDCSGWPEQVSKDKKITVSVNGDAYFETISSEPLLNALEKNGIIVPSICRAGECSMCRVKLVTGEVFHPEGTMLRKSDRVFGFIHTCVAYPLTDLNIEI